jgi:hypothetical protein
MDVDLWRSGSLSYNKQSVVRYHGVAVPRPDTFIVEQSPVARKNATLLAATLLSGPIARLDANELCRFRAASAAVLRAGLRPPRRRALG